MADQSKDGQDLMLDYLATTESTGELSLYNPDTYARALEAGRVASGRSLLQGGTRKGQPSRAARGEDPRP